MNKMFVGIDPGKQGCISGIQGEDVYCSPLLGTLTELDIIDYLLSLEPSYVVIEKVYSLPRMAALGAFNFGVSYGVLIGCLASLSVPYTEIRPQEWMKVMRCMTKGDKNVTKRKAQQLFPDLHITHGNADSLLIARYCKRYYRDLF